MLTIFNTQSLYIGNDMKRFNDIRDILDAQSIPYKYKVKDRSGAWSGRGTLRGTMGSLGTPPKLACAYEILVKKADLERARRHIA